MQERLDISVRFFEINMICLKRHKLFPNNILPIYLQWRAPIPIIGFRVRITSEPFNGFAQSFSLGGDLRLKPQAPPSSVKPPTPEMFKSGWQSRDIDQVDESWWAKPWSLWHKVSVNTVIVLSHWHMWIYHSMVHTWIGLCWGLYFWSEILVTELGIYCCMWYWSGIYQPNARRRSFW